MKNMPQGGFVVSEQGEKTPVQTPRHHALFERVACLNLNIGYGQVIGVAVQALNILSLLFLRHLSPFPASCLSSDNKFRKE